MEFRRQRNELTTFSNNKRTMTIDILRNGTVQAMADIDEKTVFQRNVMGQHKITSEFYAAAPLQAQIGDYIEFRGKPYYINTIPNIQKVNNFTFKHNITFEAEQYRLHDKKLMHLGAMSFSYTGTASDFIQLILSNINSINPGWTAGTVEATAVKTFTFDNQSCATALSQIAEAFGLEYSIDGKAISLVPSVGNVNSITVEYGKGKGLYTLIREALSDKNVVTRVYGFGGTQNIDYNYRDGAKRLTFDGGYLEKNVDLYGVKEGSVTFDDIFPQRTGTVTAVDAEDALKVTDNLIGFDLNDHLIEGEVAKIVFKSGALSGYEFEIVKYDHDTKVIEFNAFTEGNGYILPNDLNKPVVGDKYTLVNIAMPFGYISTAETALQVKVQEYLNENSVPRVVYRLELDEKFIRQNAIEINAGDRITVKDTDLGIDTLIRVAAVSFPIVNPAKITATIADFIPYTRQEKIIAQTIDNRKEIKVVDRASAEQARRNTMRMRQLDDLLFDPDGYFDTGNIRPGSIETQMLSVGVGSQNFNLNAVTISPNHEGDANALNISAGQLIHRVIEIEGLGYVWEMAPEGFTALGPLKHYYVYAKCSTTELAGTWEISETPVMTDAIPGYYAFNLGILYAVKDGYRDFAFTNGMTYIVGDQVTTGRVKDITGQNFFDLTQAKFNLGTAEEGLDWNVSAEGKLTIRGAVIASAVFADDADITNLFVSSLKTSGSGKRIEISDGNEQADNPNSFIMYDQNGNPVLIIDDDMDSGQAGNPLAGVRAINPTNGRVSFQTGNGIFSNASGAQFMPGIMGISSNASVVGLLFSRNNDPEGVSAAVVGADRTSSGFSRSYGVYCEGKMAVTDDMHVKGEIPYTGNIVAKLELDNPTIYFNNPDGSTSPFTPANNEARFYRFKFVDGMLYKIEFA